MRRPLPVITPALMAGIGLGVYFSPPAWILILSASACLVFLLTGRTPRVFIAASVLFFLLLGAALVTSALRPETPGTSIADYASGKGLSISGRVDRAPRMETDTTRIVLSNLRVRSRGTWRPVGGRLRLTVGERVSDVSYGDTVFFSGTVRKPRNFDNPGGFDYAFSLRRAGITATSFVDTRARLLVMDSPPRSPAAFVERARDTVRDFYDARFPTPEGAVIKALILGERGDIPEELLEAYYRTGVGHVLAISGSNVGIVFIFTYILIYAVLVRLAAFPLRHSARKWASVVSLVPVIVYTFMAGMEITVVRATLMICVVICAVLIEREQQTSNTLVLAAFVILVLLPTSLFDPSFQLSFVAVASILFTYRPLVEPLRRRFFPIDGVRPPLPVRIAFRLLQFSLVSCAAIVGILPLSAYYFHRLTPLALPLNFVVVPLLGPVATSLGLLSVPFAATLPRAASFLSLIAAWAISLSNRVVIWADSLLPNGINVFGPTILEMILYYGLIVSVFFFFRKRRWAAVLGVFLLLITFADVSWTAWQRYRPNRLEAAFLSVGNGDSCVITLPGGDCMIVDGGTIIGSSFDCGRYIVAPYLFSRRIGRIDYMVLSHPERDHAGGLSYLMENFPVGELWVTRDALVGKEAAPLMTSARSRDVPVIVLDSSSPPRTIGKTTVTVLNPGPAADDMPGDLNNRSLVLRLTYGRFRLLMTGDIEHEGMARIGAAPADLEAAVLKAPHHGSSYSSPGAFLRAVGPLAAVVSCGYDNPFGFPGKKTLEGLSDVGADVFRTDLDGAVTVTTDGRYVEITSMGGRRLYQDIPDPLDR